VIDPWPPYEIVALAFQGEAAFGEVDAEYAADVEDQGGSLVIGGPFGPATPGTRCGTSSAKTRC
jgi:hypothetical protein